MSRPTTVNCQPHVQALETTGVSQIMVGEYECAYDASATNYEHHISFLVNFISARHSLQSMNLQTVTTMTARYHDGIFNLHRHLMRQHRHLMRQQTRRMRSRQNLCQHRCLAPYHRHKAYICTVTWALASRCSWTCSLTVLPQRPTAPGICSMVPPMKTLAAIR